MQVEAFASQSTLCYLSEAEAKSVVETDAPLLCNIQIFFDASDSNP